MRFMMMVKANSDTEAGVMPSEKLIAAMTRYNEELSKAGVLLDLAGLQPSSKGARIKFSPGGKRAVVDGPFTETAGLVAGYWLIQVKSKEKRSSGPSAPRLPTVTARKGRSSFASFSSWMISRRAKPSTTRAS